MRRVSYLLGILLIVSMLLAACGVEETGTSVPNTDVPPVTAEATMTDEVTTTETVEGGDLTTTPAIPVTGEDSISRVSNLLDLDIWNQNNEQIGEVEDMVLDMDNSTITYVIIETGGFLGIGDKTVLIPWNSLDLQTTAEGATETAFVLTTDAEMITNAPDVDLDSVLPAIGETVADWDADIRNFWESGVIPEATQSTDATESPAATETAMPEMTATTTGSTNSGTGQGQSGKLQGVLLASDLLGATITVGNADGRAAEEGEATAMPAATTDPNATATTDAGSGSGTDMDSQGPTEARIEDMIVDPDTGDVLHLVLNSLFDDGERWIPVPLSTLRWDAANESFLFVANANALLNAPFFQADQWPDTTLDGWDTDFNDFWQTNVTTTP
jgi:sporulation protein YlmC with PRC-barrel domain